MKKQTGFTLIELVVVLVLLGILAATAVPRFQDLSDQARQSEADAILGALISTAGIRIAQSQGVVSTMSDIVANTDINASDMVTVETDGAVAGPEDIRDGVTAVECQAAANTSVTVNICASGVAEASCAEGATDTQASATTTMSSALCAN